MDPAVLPPSALQDAISERDRYGGVARLDRVAPAALHREVWGAGARIGAIAHVAGVSDPASVLNAVTRLRRLPANKQ